MPTQVYRSSDALAPELTGHQAESLMDILQACLVDGYGAKSGAGWTLAYTATGKRVFRNNPITGSGCYVRVAVAASSNKFMMQAFAAMSDVDTGTTGTGECGFVSSRTDDATPRQWCIVADDLTFYARFWGEYGNINLFTTASGLGLIGAGDYISDLGVAFNYFVAGGNTANEDSHVWLSMANRYGLNFSGAARAPSPDGIGAVDVSHFTGPTATNSTSTNFGNSSVAQAPFSAINQLIKVEPLIGGSKDSARHLGRLRGCFFPCQNLFTHLEVEGSPGRWGVQEPEPGLVWLWASTNSGARLSDSCTGLLVKTDSWT